MSKIIKIEELDSWDKGINKVLMGDCISLMKMMPDKCVDLVLTDPPYGTKTSNRNGMMVGEFSNVMPLVLPELFRILKPGGAFYCFTSWTMVADWLLRYQQYFKLQNIIIWDKQKHSGCYSPASWQFTWEGIFFGIKGKHKIRKYMPDVIKSEQKGRRRAMEKPVDILKDIIEASSDENMIVFDPFMGSWTTARACKDLGRNFIGCELSEDYCKIGLDRL